MSSRSSESEGLGILFVDSLKTGADPTVHPCEYIGSSEAARFFLDRLPKIFTPWGCFDDFSIFFYVFCRPVIGLVECVGIKLNPIVKIDILSHCVKRCVPDVRSDGLVEAEVDKFKPLRGRIEGKILRCLALLDPGLSQLLLYCPHHPSHLTLRLEVASQVELSPGHVSTFNRVVASHGFLIGVVAPDQGIEFGRFSGDEPSNLDGLVDLNLAAFVNPDARSWLRCL